jgi:hypothetical protein
MAFFALMDIREEDLWAVVVVTAFAFDCVVALYI